MCFLHHKIFVKSLATEGFKVCYIPDGPTTKNTSAISSLLNIAAFRSLILVLAACQLGSRVEALALLKLMGRGEAKGEVGVLLEGGCVIWMTSPDDGPPTTPPPPPPPWLST